MHNEKQNNSVSWKDKLDDLSGFANEEMLDKNEAWNKLHNRLRKNPRNNKMIFYWLAAACLLLVFFLPKMINKKNGNELANHISTQNKKETKSDKPVLQLNESINKTKIASVKIERKAGNNFINKNIINHHFKNELKDIPVAINNLKNNNTVIINALIIKDTPLIVIASLPVKKKLHVLHINEIENGNEGMASSNANDQQHINLPFAKTNDISKQKTSASHDYAGIIKIKIYSSN